MFDRNNGKQKMNIPIFKESWIQIIVSIVVYLLVVSCNRNSDEDISISTDSFTDLQPYKTERDIRNFTTRILTENGQLIPNTIGYPFDDYDDPAVLEALEFDWEDNNLPQSLRDTLRGYYFSASFKNNIAHESGDMAYIALSGFRNPTSQENADLNNNLFFIINPENSPGLYWNSERPSWAPSMPLSSNLYTIRNWFGNPDNDAILINDNHDGVNGDLIASGLENEAEELRYDNVSPPDITQACEDLVAFMRTVKLWNDQSVREDDSPIGTIRKDQIIRLGLTGFSYTPEKEILLNNLYGFWPGVKESPSGENILEEGLLSAKPSLSPDNVEVATGSYSPGEQRISEIERIIGRPLPSNNLDSEAYVIIRSSLNDWINNNEEFKDFLENELGPLVPSDN